MSKPLAIYFLLAIPCLCFIPANDLFYEREDHQERFKGNERYLFSCEEEQTSCFRDLKFAHLNKSYSQKLLDFIFQNDDIPITCRSGMF